MKDAYFSNRNHLKSVWFDLFEHNTITNTFMTSEETPI